jgi:hypothetical protein
LDRKPSVAPEPILDAVVVEDGESNASFSNPTWAYENNGSKFDCEVKNLPYRVLPSKSGIG